MTLTAEAFGFVRDLVHRESAIVLAPGKEYLVESRLLPLARAHGDADTTAFVDRVRRQAAGPLARDVVEALTTNETSWMRDSSPFAALRDQVIPSLLPARAAKRKLRIWCAASSSGQEPYSIAMTVAEMPKLAGWTTEIIGTDLSTEMVDRCKAARYSQLEVNRGMPATALVKHFTRDGASWRVNPQLTAMTSFRQKNLVRPFPPMGTFDIVFLRNVLIYFDLPTKRDVLRRVRQVMAPDGYLYLGAAEMTMGVDDAWERVPTGRSSVYRIKGGLT
jgi:chemotaxis protein methyltransferase CheR